MYFDFTEEDIQEIAERLERIYNRAWNKFHITCYENLSSECIRYTVSEIDKLIEDWELPSELPMEVFDYLESDNFHSLNSILCLMGLFGVDARHEEEIYYTSDIPWVRGNAVKAFREVFNLDFQHSHNKQ